MYVFNIFGACLVLFFPHSTALDVSLLPKVGALVSTCDTCSNLVKSVLKELDLTNPLIFQVPYDDYETEMPPEVYENSELRFISILNNACYDLPSGKDELDCHNLVNLCEDKLRVWFFKKRKQNVNISTFLCINELKVCCPNNTYGRKCFPCPGGIENPCSGHGKCHNAGTREGPGHCICEIGYSGNLCQNCEIGYYRNDSLSSCVKCDDACKSYCKGPGPKNCEFCEDGYSFSESEGCVRQYYVNNGLDGSRISILVSAILNSMQSSGFNYQNLGNTLSHLSSGTNTCNSYTNELMLDTIMASLHVLTSYGSGNVSVTPSPEAMSAFSQSIRSIF